MEILPLLLIVYGQRPNYKKILFKMEVALTAKLLHILFAPLILLTMHSLLTMLPVLTLHTMLRLLR